tara:strand:+ start:1692 stop:2162 length:471 start_codon:yes stop_codon:yes gene_type:complete
MAKSQKLVTLIREMVRQEVKKEVNKIFISEGAKAMSQKTNSVPEVLPVPKKSKPKDVSYTKNPTLNKILNETAQQSEYDEYPTMTGQAFNSSRMAEAIGYGNIMGDAESRREAAAIQTAQAAGVDTSSEAVQNVMQDLTKDYRGVMNALKKKDGKE